MPSKLTNGEFIEKVKLKHGDKWDYSKVDYTGSKNKVIIICKEHGEFTQTASDHLAGCGCPNCDPTKRLTADEFIKKSVVMHGDRWDYSRVKYGKNNYDLVEILCKEHGIFQQRPWAHLRGQGCPKCVNNTIMTTREFIERCIEKHGDRWDYSITEYIGRRREVSIICKNHGIFKQEARVHLEGFGCKMCNNSRMEHYLSVKLRDMNEPFETNKKFKDCKNKNPLPFDFYLPLRNMLIECDGIQHRESIEYFGGQERLEYQKNNDKIKNKWSEERGIQLIRLDNNLEIDNFIKSLQTKKLVFDKSVLKDLKENRTNPKKKADGYLRETDFNWLNSGAIHKEIDMYISGLRVNFSTNFTFKSENINWIVNNNYIILIDNFKDSEINRNKNWLVILKNELESLNKNLIVIYPEDWILNKEITKSRLRNILNLNQIKIGARECQIIIPQNKSVSKFLIDNHIQGHVNGSIKIALTYNDEIVSLMTFGKLRRNLGNTSKLDSYELLRFCNKKNYSVIGSASKLMSFFKKQYSPKYILSYADRCWTSINKNIYKELGMDLVSKTPPSYSYLVGEKKYDRFRYRKDKLIEFGYDKDKWTERSICSSNLVFKIFDAGCLKYEMNL